MNYIIEWGFKVNTINYYIFYLKVSIIYGINSRLLILRDFKVYLLILVIRFSKKFSFLKYKIYF